jgi:lysophospholipase L1-like esterase
MHHLKNKNINYWKKGFLVNALIILGITILIILVLEIFLRLFFPQNLYAERITGETFSYMDEMLGMQYTPRARWQFFHPEYVAEYAINEHGFRDARNYSTPKPEDNVRVLLLGDSFTFGQGVNYDQAWPVKTEKMLINQGNNSVELVKAGVQGMDSRSEFILLKRLLEKYQIDVVVVGFLINDLYTNSLYGIEESKDDELIDKGRRLEEEWSQTSKQVFMKGSLESEFHLLTLAKRMVISIDEVYCRLYIAAPNRGGWLNKELPKEAVEKLKVTEVIFQEMARYLNSLGKKLIVVSIPQQFQVLYYEDSQKSPSIDVELYDRHFTQFAERNHFTWITTLDNFARFNQDKSKLFYRLDGHLTPAGNDLVANAFLDEVMPIIQLNKRMGIQYGSLK